MRKLIGGPEFIEVQGTEDGSLGPFHVDRQVVDLLEPVGAE